MKPLMQSQASTKPIRRATITPHHLHRPPQSTTALTITSIGTHHRTTYQLHYCKSTTVPLLFLKPPTVPPPVIYVCLSVSGSASIGENGSKIGVLLVDEPSHLHHRNSLIGIHRRWEGLGMVLILQIWKPCLPPIVKSSLLL